VRPTDFRIVLPGKVNFHAEEKFAAGSHFIPGFSCEGFDIARG
jgi:hypothetical protein